MEKAGYWVANACAARLKPYQKVLVLAGPGNNGAMLSLQLDT